VNSVKTNMAKALKLACTFTSKFVSGNSTRLFSLQKQSSKTMKHCFSSINGGLSTSSSRAHSSLSSVFMRSAVHTKGCGCLACKKLHIASYSTEVDKEISKFLDKEIQYESSRSSDKLPKIAGFDIKTEEGDITLTKTSGAEKIVVKLSVNGAVDSAEPGNPSGKEDEPPKMVCRPPFDVEIIKGNTVLALQCAFPSPDAVYEGGQENEQIDDQFEIQEVSIHGGEWKDTTYSVSAATMDAELFDLLMDMLDERGINDEFIAQLVDYCTVYENKQYINFLQNLKSFVEK